MRKKLFFGVVAFSTVMLLFLSVYLKTNRNSSNPDGEQVKNAAQTLGKITGPNNSDPLTKQQALEQSKKIARQLTNFFELNLGSSEKANPAFGLARGFGTRVPNPEQQRAVDKLLKVLPADTVLHMDGFTGTLRYLRGDLSSAIQGSSEYAKAKAVVNYDKMAYAILSELDDVMRLKAPEEEFIVTALLGLRGDFLLNVAGRICLKLQHERYISLPADPW